MGSDVNAAALLDVTFIPGGASHLVPTSRVGMYVRTTCMHSHVHICEYISVRKSSKCNELAGKRKEVDPLDS